MPTGMRSTPRASDRAGLRSALGALAEIPNERFPKGSHVLEQDGPPRSVFLVRSGLLKLAQLDPNRRSTIAGLRLSGGLLGLEAALLATPQPLTVVALTDCELTRVPAKVFRQRLRTSATFSWFVHLEQSKDVYRLLDQTVRLARLAARERLEDVLRLIQKETAGSAQEAVAIPLREWELAELLAITPQYLCRLMHTLRDRGVLELRAGVWHYMTSSHATPLERHVR